MKAAAVCLVLSLAGISGAPTYTGDNQASGNLQPAQVSSLMPMGNNTNDLSAKAAEVPDKTDATLVADDQYDNNRAQHWAENAANEAWSAVDSDELEGEWGHLEASLPRHYPNIDAARTLGSPVHNAETTMVKSLGESLLHIDEYVGGRLGNQIISICKALLFAAKHGCDVQIAAFTEEHRCIGISIPNQRTLFTFPVPEGADQSACREHENVTDSIYWWEYVQPPESEALNHAQKEDQLAVADRYAEAKAQLLGMSETTAVGQDCTEDGPVLAMQIRAGDIFEGSWGSADARDYNVWQPSEGPEGPGGNPGYAQPSLSFYATCLNDYLGEGDAAIAVCESDDNPVCIALRSMALVGRLKLSVVSAVPLAGALHHLSCAPIVCGAHSSMKNIYVNDFHTKKYVEAPEAASALAPWRNSGLQREAMLK